MLTIKKLIYPTDSTGSTVYPLILRPSGTYSVLFPFVIVVVPVVVVVVCVLLCLPKKNCVSLRICFIAPAAIISV